VPPAVCLGHAHALRGFAVQPSLQLRVNLGLLGQTLRLLGRLRGLVPIEALPLPVDERHVDPGFGRDVLGVPPLIRSDHVDRLDRVGQAARFGDGDPMLGLGEAGPAWPAASPLDRSRAESVHPTRTIHQRPGLSHSRSITYSGIGRDPVSWPRPRSSSIVL
jgi:hypothetical protein